MKIRTRIFLVFVLTVVGGFYFLVQWIADDLRPRYLESLEEPLVDTAYLLADLLAADVAAGNLAHLRAVFEHIYARHFSARIYALEKQRVDMRVYITDRQGIVLFDSSGRDEGADYSRWNDVYLTLHGRYGVRATREDPKHPEVSVLYIAAPIVVAGEIIGVVSVGKPGLNADRFIALARQKLIDAGLAAAAAVLVLGLILYAWVSRPLEQLIGYARAVKAGERVPLPQLGRNEIGMMGAAMEDMRTALAGKDYVQRYVQTLTHELKSPLAAIRGAAELLDENPPDEARHRFLANIHSETQRLQALVERMLELAALEQRQGLEQVESIDLSQLARDVITSLEPLTTLKRVVMVNRIADCPPLCGERFLLRQALANLLRNALEFSPAGSTVTLSAARTADTLHVSVSDQGPGVPDYALSRVFERFYSLPRPDSGAKSTGLGLSFVKEVAELHNGTATLDNQPEGGAVATLHLPLTP